MNYDEIANPYIIFIISVLINGSHIYLITYFDNLYSSAMRRVRKTIEKYLHSFLYILRLIPHLLTHYIYYLI